MSNHFSEAQKKQLLQSFKLFDIDNDGQISEKQMASLVKELDPTQTDEQINTLISEVDVDASGTIDFPEFLVLMGRKMACVTNPADIKEAFDLLDTNQDGFITFQELKEGLRKIGDTSSDVEITNMMKEADLDGDEKISFEEFKQLMAR